MPDKHGHPRFFELTRAEEELHSRKNKDYASTGHPMGNFDRVSALLRQYPGFPYDTNYGVAFIYMLKQLDAALHLISERREGEVEGVAERLGDISVYAKLIRIMYEDRELDR